ALVLGGAARIEQRLGDDVLEDASLAVDDQDGAMLVAHRGAHFLNARVRRANALIDAGEDREALIRTNRVPCNLLRIPVGQRSRAERGGRLARRAVGYGRRGRPRAPHGVDGELLAVTVAGLIALYGAYTDAEIDARVGPVDLAVFDGEPG